MGDAKRGHSNTKQETAIKMAKYLLMDGFFLTSALFIIFLSLSTCTPGGIPPEDGNQHKAGKMPDSNPGP
jgi:hypothetical protein